MNTFEITLQRKTGESWPVVAISRQVENELPFRNEGLVQIDLDQIRAFLDARKYGTYLGKSIFQAEVRDAWVRALANARQMSNSLRVLLTVEAEELKTLHWERLCAPLNGGWDLLVFNQETPFSQYLPSLTDRRYPSIGRRDLRALVLVAGPQDLGGDYQLDSFDIPATLASIQNSLGEIPCDILASDTRAVGEPTLETLCERLTSLHYTILHMVFHGRFNPSNGETLLYFPDENRRPITASRLIERLARLPGAKGLPYFTFLMACESASPEAETGFGGLGQRLVRELGMPAVLAMTGQVSIATANQLAGKYYTRLNEHGETDLALSQAVVGLAGQLDATVPAVFSRLGGRPLFSAALDRDLTPQEIRYGLERLGRLVAGRAPVLDAEFKALETRLGNLAEAAPETLSPAARDEQAAGLQAAEELSLEVADLSFNALALDEPVPAYDDRCPFRGLAPFRTEDQAFFFGREALVARLVARLEEHPFLAVLGPSGSGKSSLVLAGLVPALQASAKPGPTIVYLTPGADPQGRLTAALETNTTSGFVVIDQFEELFTLCRDEVQRKAFIQRIIALYPENKVVLTMRADFWGECAPYAEFKQAMQAHQELVAPMDLQDLRRAIEQQAASVGLRFEADLAADILDDVQGEPGAMPLLQHALLLLWHRRRGRWLRNQEYRAFGGVQQAIAHTADKLYLDLSEADQQRMRAIFLRLTRLDEDLVPSGQRRDTRRRVALPDLVPAGGDPEATNELVRQLADARLLVTGLDPASGEDQVEVAHEALIRYWPRLVRWLDEDRADLRLVEGVREAAQEWEAGQMDENLLVHRGGRLEDALELAGRQPFAFNQRETDYLAACMGLRVRERQAVERRRNLALVAALVVAALMVVLGGYGWYQAGRAGEALSLSEKSGTQVALYATAAATALIDSQTRGTQAVEQANVAAAERARAENEAVISLARQLAAQARENLEAGSDLPLAMLLAIESYQLHAEQTNYQVLVDTLWQLPKTIYQLKPEDDVTAIAFSQDGKLVIKGTQDGSVIVSDIAAGRQLAQKKYASRVTVVAISPDRRWVASGHKNGTTRVWELATGKEQSPLILNSNKPIISIFFSQDSRRLVSRTDDEIWLWESDSWRYLTSNNKSPSVADLSPDGSRIYLGSRTKTASILSIGEAGEPIFITQKDNFLITNVYFSPDGKWIATGNDQGVVRLMSAIDGSEIFQIAPFDVFAFDPVAPRMVLGGGDSIIIWGISSRKILTRMTHKDVSVLAFSSDGQQVVSGGEDGTAFIWDASSGRELARMNYPSPVKRVAFLPDQKQVLLIGTDFSAAVWEAAGSSELYKPYEIFETQRLNYIQDPMTEKSIAISKEKTWVAAGHSYGAIEIFDYNSGHLIYQMMQDDQVNTLAFSPEGKRLISGSAGGTVRIWDIASEKEIARQDHGVEVTSVTTNSDGTWIIFGDVDGGITVWDADTHNILNQIVQEKGILKLSVSPDSQYLVTWGTDGMARVWKIKDRVEVAKFQPPEELLREISFNPEGDRVLFLRGEDDSKSWLWDPAAMIKLACSLLERRLTPAEIQQYLDGRTGKLPCSGPLP